MFGSKGQINTIQLSVSSVKTEKQTLHYLQFVKTQLEGSSKLFRFFLRKKFALSCKQNKFATHLFKGFNYSFILENYKSINICPNKTFNSIDSQA